MQILSTISISLLGNRCREVITVILTHDTPHENRILFTTPVEQKITIKYVFEFNRKNEAVDLNKAALLCRKVITQFTNCKLVSIRHLQYWVSKRILNS